MINALKQFIASGESGTIEFKESFGKAAIEALETDFYRASHRNKLLAEGFHLSGEVEKYGTGFVRIRERLKNEAPELKLSFKEDSGAFWVSLEGVAAIPEHVPEKTAQINAQINAQKTAQKIIDTLRGNPTAGRAEIAKIIGDITEDGVKYHLTKLKKQGIIRRIGPDKGGYWEVSS